VHSTDKRLFLLDAMALIYRAYFALIRNPLINSKGVNVSAIQVFTNTLYDLINRENPSHMAVVFDKGEPVERTKLFADYKATRQETPGDIIASMEPIREIIEASGIPCIELDGYEADDIIGTLAREAEQQGYTTYMVTPDKDFGQLVTDSTVIYKPITGGGGFDTLGVKDILEKWDITDVRQVIDILGLMGDSVDNIPGIPGVGEKTAIKLLKAFGSIENMLAHTDKIPGKLRQKVEDNRDHALLSKQLATIDTSVPIPFEEERLQKKAIDKPRLAAIFDKLEFRTIAKRILGEESKPVAAQASLFGASADNGTKVLTITSIDSTPHKYVTADSSESTALMVQELMGKQRVGVATVTDNADPMRAKLLGIAFSAAAHEAWFAPIAEESAQETLDRLKPLLSSGSEKVSLRLKEDILVLRRYGCTLAGVGYDAVIAHFLLEPEVSQDTGIVAESYLGYRPIDVYSLMGRRAVDNGSFDLLGAALSDVCCEWADIAFQLRSKLEAILQERESGRLFHEVEMPLLYVLADMQFEGVKVDVAFLQAYSKQLNAQIEEVRQQVYGDAGAVFNIDSPKQLGDILFDKLKLPYEGRKTKTGQYSTSEEVLLPLAGMHAIVNDILTYRELTKLKSTYVDALPQLLNPDTGRVHTTLSQVVAVTGRLSSNNPNLQNIPIRTERGREIRKAFVPRDGNHVLLSADYSQIELRIIASLSEDENLIDAFRSGFDIHSSTASKVYGVPLNQVTPEMRRNAKTVNFGIIYGISAFGLSQRLGISRKEGQELIDTYFAQYPKVKQYMDHSIQFARENGFVATVLGRRRYLKDIHARNYTVRSFAERNAINSPIQGSAADMIKIAMVNVHAEMIRRKLRSRMILQVHDELLFDVVRDEAEQLKELVVEKMTTAIRINVPIGVEVGIGENWLVAH
jgi:DNA polymerase-1